MNHRLSTVLLSVFGAATVLTACWAPGAGRYAPIPDRTRSENVAPSPEDSSTPCTEPLGCTPPPVYTPPVDDHRPPAGPQQPEPEADRRVEPPTSPCDPCTAPPPVPPGPRPLVADVGPAGVLDPAGQAPHGSDERFVPPTPAGQAPAPDPDGHP